MNDHSPKCWGKLLHFAEVTQPGSPGTAFCKMAESDDITDLVEQFMTVTGVEDTAAMCYLQQSGWDLQVNGHLSLYIAK